MKFSIRGESMKFVCSCGNPTDNLKVIGNTVLHTCDECLERISKEVDWESENEHWRERTIVCPYCDYEYEMYDAYNYEDNEEEVECPECGKKFDLEVEHTRYFSTKRSVCEMPEDYEGTRN